VYYPNLMSNVEVLRRTGQQDMVTDITDRKWRWIGHMAMKHAQHLTRQAFEWHRTGRRGRGRPDRLGDEQQRRKLWMGEEDPSRGYWRTP
jgi:hypothetical protein